VTDDESEERDCEEVICLTDYSLAGLSFKRVGWFKSEWYQFHKKNT